MSAPKKRSFHFGHVALGALLLIVVISLFAKPAAEEQPETIASLTPQRVRAMCEDELRKAFEREGFRDPKFVGWTGEPSFLEVVGVPTWTALGMTTRDELRPALTRRGFRCVVEGRTVEDGTIGIRFNR